MDTVLFLVPRGENSTILPAFRLRSGKQMIGRTPQCQIFLPDPTVSREHAVLNVMGEEATLTDLNSRNGTWVNDVQIQSKVILRGQEIRFGRSVFVISSDPNQEYSLDVAKPTEVASSTRHAMNPTETLKPRQVEVLEWLLQGLNEKEVAAKLGISRETVHNHVRGIYAAYHVHSRVELLLKVNPMKGTKIPISKNTGR